MQEYRIAEFLDAAVEPPEQEGTVIVCGQDEWDSLQLTDLARRSYDLIRRDVRYCRAETLRTSFFGTLCFPNKKNLRGAPADGIHFALSADRLILVDSDASTLQWCEELRRDRPLHRTTPAAVLFDFIRMKMSGDDILLDGLKNRMYRMEENILGEKPSAHIGEQILRTRHDLLTLRSYYDQMQLLAETVAGNANGAMTKADSRLFGILAGRCGHYLSDAQMLLDYSVQVRDLYQTQIDVKQNQIMKMLTIVTTLFLPLTLVAGWYGMNFTYMPELEWEYSYLFVIALCTAIVGFNVHLFRKHGFFK